MSIAKRFSFVWRDANTDEWSYCFGSCVFVSVNHVGVIHKTCRFLARPETCEGYFPYEASGSGHVELFDTILYLKHVLVSKCKCDYGCEYYVWECSVDVVVDKENPCEA